MSAPAQNTHFTFEHKVFDVEGGYFALVSGQTAFHLRLGEMDVSISNKQLSSEFAIETGSDDGKQLKLVADALRFVKKIRPGDSIPTELIDGTASWTVEESHLEVAKNRLSLQLASWLQGEEVLVLDAKKLSMMLQDRSVKDKVQKAFVEIAEHLDLGPNGKTVVANRVDQFATELSYVEALKDRVQKVADIRAKIQQIAKLRKNDQMQMQELMRMETLMRDPLRGMADRLEGLYSQTSEIMSVLKTFEKQVEYVRRTRDDLRTELIDWDDLLERWEHQPADLSDEAEALCKHTYRFLAQNYQQVQRWASAS